MFDKVMTYFKELCSIPHGSGNTKQITAYCIDFAKKHALRYASDETGNVIIFKDATEGYENSPAVILQGHLDMVCVKTDETDIDFEADGLTLCEDDDFIWANGTSLGGDDGIAVAYALAVLASDEIAHPPLEVLLTVDEEIGMLGADALDVSPLSGKMLINIDSEEEDTLLVSCAGGVRADITVPIKTAAKSEDMLSVTLSGFTGGHSGTEIDKGRSNAVITMAKLLKNAGVKSIASIDGGSADNAIPVSCTAVVYGDDISAVKNNILGEFDKIKKACADADPNAAISIAACKGGQVLTDESTAVVLDCIASISDGVIAFSSSIDGLVQTSLNLGIIKTGSDTVTLCHALRSSVNSEKAQLSARLEAHAKSFGGEINFYGDYPAWEYKEESKLREIICSAYEKINGEKMKIASIHAGLECGLFCGKIDGLDCVSMGPNIFDIHTTDEKLSKKSAERVFNLLLDVLSSLK